MNITLNGEGFITHWLISGPSLSDFQVEKSCEDQLAYEKYMRGIVRDNKLECPAHHIVLGETSNLGQPWRYYGGGNWYVDVSVFYSLPVKVELYAATILVAEKDMNVCADAWTYAAIDLYLNNERICVVENPVYKPITRRQLTLNLKKGENPLFIRMQNLGVRDTRSIFGLQIRERQEQIHVSLPGGFTSLKVADADNWLRSLRFEKDFLLLGENRPEKIAILPANMEVIGSSVHIPDDIRKVTIEVSVAGQKLSRSIEISENIRPKWAKKEKSADECYEDIFRRIAQADKPGDKFTIFNVLARYHTGTNTTADSATILENIERISQRIDCSDFIAIGLIRLMKLFNLNDTVMQSIRKTFLNYRFWMDENGADGMCFWSENHSLLFHGTQLIIGGMYPDDMFLRSGRTGSQQEKIGYQRCCQWFDSVESEGFEEFLSSGYMCVTFGALLNLIDFGPQDISQRASSVADKLLRQLCLHTYHGTVIGPQGRVYRDVIYPFEQGTQAIIHAINPKAPYADDHWLACLVGTTYRTPDDLHTLMEQNTSRRYENGNGEIVIEKHSNYILTSVSSPFKGDDKPVWRNIAFDKVVNRDSFLYTKSLNERFHGTTQFEPGVFGYQQHFWYAALDNECVVFSNHPGGTVDSSSMRPGYWYGNGIFPALSQKENMLGLIYSIPESYPIHFTHLFFPAAKFDEHSRDGNWIFARKGDGWLGIWCSTSLEKHDDMVFNCELRCRADRCAYVCICGDRTSDGTFERFIKHCKEKSVHFDEGHLLLTYGKNFALRYSTYVNSTQYI